MIPSYPELYATECPETDNLGCFTDIFGYPVAKNFTKTVNTAQNSV